MTGRLERWGWMSVCATIFVALCAGGGGPLAVMFPLAATAALFLPGYLIVSFWPALREMLESRLERAAMSMLLSVIVQTLFCVVTLEIGLRLRWVALFQVLLMCAVLAWAIRRRRDLALSSSRLIDAASWFTLGGVAAFAGLAVAAYAGGGYVDRMQTVLARKMAENPSPHKLSIMYMPGQPHTYLYEPLGFTIAWVANATGADVIVVTDKFWAVDILMTGIFGAAFVSAAVRWRFGAAIALAFAFFAVLKYPLVDLVLPYPNRYGFGPGVLVPAAAWLIVRAEESNRSWSLMALLPAFLLCMAVFHAREALLTLLVFGLFAVAVILARPERRKAAVRYGASLACCAALLGAFSVHHRRNVEHVQSVTQEIKRVLRDEVRKMFAGDPSATDPDYHLDVPGFVGTYELGRFYGPLAGTAKPAQAYPLLLTAALLPAAIVLTRRCWVWFGVASVAGVLTFSYFPILFTTLSAAVGTTDLFQCATFFFALLPLIFTCVLIEIGAAVGRATRPLGLRSRAALAVAVNGVAVLAWRAVDPILTAHLTHSNRLLALLWIGVGAAIVVVVAVEFAGRRRPERSSWRGLDPGDGSLYGCLLATAACVPLVWNHFAAEPFDAVVRQGIREGRPIDDLYEDYDRVVVRINMISPLPRALVQHIREEVPPLSKFLAPYDVMTLIPLYANQYVAHAGTQLSTDAEYYRRWYSRHQAHLIFNDLPVAPFYEDNLRFLDDFAVDYLVVTPAYQERLRPYFAAVNAASPVFHVEFEEAGFSVVRVDRAAIPRALEQIR